MFRLFLVSIFLLPAPPGLAFDDTIPQDYKLPTLARCNVSAPTIMTDVGDCLFFDGVVDFRGGYSSVDGFSTALKIDLGATSVSSLQLGRLVTHIGFVRPFNTFIYGSGWANPDLSISEIYVSAGTDEAFLLAGKTNTSIVNTSDDRPFDFLGLIGTDAGDPRPDDDKDDYGVIWPIYSAYSSSPQPPRIHLAGRSIQSVWKRDDTLTAALAAEALDEKGTLAGVLSFDDGTTSAHFSAVAGEFLTGAPRLAYHTGATISPAPWRFRAAIAGDDSGALHAMGSGKLGFDRISVAVSADAMLENKSGYQDWIGLSASAAAELTDGFTVELGGRIHCADMDCSDANRTSQLAMRLTLQLSESLAFRSEGGVYQIAPSIFSFIGSTSYAAGEIEWQPSSYLKASLKHQANNLGAYATTFSLKRSIGAPLD